VVIIMQKESKAELMLHPVRFRIVQSLLGGRQRTAQEIGEELADVPQATLYRQINKLVEGGLVNVIDQRPIRGTIEKVFALQDAATDLTDDMSAMSRDEHMRTFMMFVASLIDDFDRYLRQDDFNLSADGVSFRKATLYLSDEEFAEVVKAMRSVLESAMSNPPSPERRRRTFTNIILPEPKKEGET
jgi:predicted ArsR family transcriptional regulator